MKLDNKVLAALGAAKPAGKDEPDDKNNKKAKASKPEPTPADKANTTKKPDDTARKADDAKKADDDAAAAAAAVNAIIDESMKGIASNIGGDDDGSVGLGADKPVGGKIVRKSNAKETDTEDKSMRTMESMDFYEQLGNQAYDFDRGFGLSGDLRSWIKKVMATDNSLIKEFITGDLEEAIKADSDLLKSAKKTVATVEASMIPYIVLFASKLDGTEYEDRDEAEASIAQYKAIGATFNSSFTKVYRRLEANGEIGDRVRIDEVKDFIEQFSGDKEALRQRLFISNKK
ncbi:hypothetical protein IK112_03240 [Candidatus Saccharibacteria bacterium]|nr:hypothetical protein [Candidatus Saccharibacteria bacterium]